MESKIVEIHSPKELVIAREELRIDNLDKNEVAAETLYSAISPGTEVAAYRGDPPLRPGKVYPRVVGYCNVAEVVSCGKNVENYEAGDLILTFQSHRSSFICSEEKIVAKISKDVDLKEASVTYLFHLGYNALLRGGLMPGYNVAVVGLGTIGLTTIALGSVFGAKVYGLSNQKKSLEIAKDFGSRLTLRKDNEKIIDRIFTDTNGTGIDLIVNTSNEWEDWELCLRLARKGGTISVLGFPGRSQQIPSFNPMDSQYFYDKQLTIIAAGYSYKNDADVHDIRFTIKRNCRFLLDLITNRKIHADKIISSVVKWNEIENVYKTMSMRKEHFLSAVLKWR